MSADKNQQEREKSVRAFNATMVKIWREQMALLGVIDTGALYRSTVGISRKYYASVMNIQEFYADSLSQEFCRAISNALNPDIMRRAVTLQCQVLAKTIHHRS
ncbi:MAG: hypothetical protein K2G67_01350 [Muribaculaceae bacterium]|nr:hypothetical protein [Muribaculaceae bacterium]